MPFNEQIFDQYRPEEPIASLRQIQVLYGALAEATSGEVVSGDPEYSLHYTPDKLRSYVRGGSEPALFVTVSVDLTKEAPAPADVDVHVSEFDEEDVRNLGFANYQPKGPDHSITRVGSKSPKEAEGAIGYVNNMLTGWTNGGGTEPSVGEVANSHPDGWVIDELARLGAADDTQENIANRLNAQYSGEHRAVYTVRLKLDPDDLAKAPNDGEPRWFYPGQVDVLNAGMEARKTEKLAEKNNVKEPSKGEGVGLITNEATEVFGTADDPLNHFTIQQAGTFPDMKREESWRNHPISLEAALTLQSGEDMVKNAKVTRNGLQVFILPYFEEVTVQRAEWLYDALHEMQQRQFGDGGEHPMHWLERTIGEWGTEDDRKDLRFYVISRWDNSGDINVFHELPEVRLYEPRKVAQAHETTLKRSTAFGDTLDMVAFELEESWQLITGDDDQRSLTSDIIDGAYAWPTFPTRGSDDPVVDDPQEEFTHSLLIGERVDVNFLLKQYMKQLTQALQDDGQSRHPTRHVKTQFAQLEALAQANQLTAPPNQDELTKPATTYMSEESVPSFDKPDITNEILSADEGPQVAIRRRLLDHFLENRPSLKDRGRRSAFLTGVLVGMLSHHQQTSRDMFQTLVDQYPADQVTKDQLTRLWPKLTQRASVYTKDVSWATDTLFPEVFDKQTEGLQHPEEWDIPIHDIRFFYSLGIAYGQRADSRAHEIRNELAERGEREQQDASTETEV